MKLELLRYVSTENGIIGVLKYKDYPICYTLERPYLNNEKNISAIPDGEYACLLKYSPNFGNVYEVMDVPNRTDILIHVGNELNDSSGCILVGLQQSMFNNRFLVMNSRLAFTKLMDFLNDNISFNLQVCKI